MKTVEVMMKAARGGTLQVDGASVANPTTTIIITITSKPSTPLYL
jgi:hypothetical protein